MKRRLKKFVALVLSIVFLIVMLPVGSVAVYADTENLAIPTHRYVLADNTGYNFAGKSEVNKCFSNNTNYIAVSMSGNGITQKSYGGKTAFAVPYWNQSAYLEIDHVNANWKTDTNLGSATRSDGTNCEWKVNNDTYKFNDTSTGEEHTVQNGLLVMEISDDGVNWQKHEMINFPAGKQTHKWNLDADMLVTGKYFRISFMFEAYTTWRTGWWIFGSDHSEYKNVIEVSNPFFVSVNGYGNEDFGVATIKNLSQENISAEDMEGFTSEEIKSATTLTDNSMTTTGFVIDCDMPAYKIEVAKNGGTYKTVKSGYTEESDGVYSIRLTSKFGEKKAITIYVQKQNPTESYFGKPFSSAPGDIAFIQGKRILSGTNANLMDYGIELAYDWAKIPVYEKGATYNIKSSRGVIPVSGQIIGECPEGDINIEVSSNEENVIGTLDQPGYYSALLSTVNAVGDKFTFSFNWWIVDSNPGAQINQQLILHKSQEIYDLKPIYYSVVQERGPFTYDYEGKTIEKAGQMVFAFADYGQALNLALRIEKQYAQRHSGNSALFYYRHADNPNIPLNEFELYQQMLTKAKLNVKLNYFSHNNEYTLRGLGSNEIITDEGYLILADDPSNPVIAPIVALNLAERAALTERSNIINHYSFLSASQLDSTSIAMKNKDTEELYYIEYDKDVGSQLIQKNATSGIYQVCETNIYGIESFYDVKFLNPSEQNDITIKLQLSDGVKYITAADSGAIYQTESFCIEEAFSFLDTHGLILITKERDQIPIDIKDISPLTFNDKGEYAIQIEDRIGRSYCIKIIII